VTTSSPLDAGRLETMRLERLTRLQAAMHDHDVEACLLFNEPNVRYATGASTMPVYAMSTFARCALVPQEGTPILFEHPNSIHRSRTRAPDVRPMHAWEFFDDPGVEATTWAGMMIEALKELGVTHTSARTVTTHTDSPTPTSIAVDRMGTPAFLALEERGVTFRDSAPVTQEARRVKTPGELALFDLNEPLIHQMLATVETAIEPGISERELLAEMARTMLRGGGEYLATNTICSGPNTNPWRAEATDRRLQTGDLVFIDTDTVGIEGCFFCVSRTFTVGSPSPEQKATYEAARHWVEAMKALVRPGLTCGELAAEAPRIPERFVEQRYECMVHGIGLEEENPSVCHPQDRQSNADSPIAPGTILVVECYMGEVGADHGVKLGDEIVVTDEGSRTLVRYPWSTDF
jgi:Xaa-Pro dipeptidase